MHDDAIHEIAFSDYPVTMQNMHNPPKKLHMRGRLSEQKDQKYLCVVGSRRSTSYGKDAVYKIIRGLAGYPITIVSGLAIGIDSLAHMAALDAGLHCVAFPGSTLDWEKIYPSAHTSLARRIVGSGGALISQWGPDYPAEKLGSWAFPSRNVLMAGISQAVLVIEAGYRSGSLMTAKHALDFHRDVLAVPGHIDAPQSYGPHMLIRDGAGLVTCSEDVLRALGFGVQADGGSAALEAMENRLMAMERSGILDEMSSEIMRRLLLEEMVIDDLARAIGVPAQSLNERLTMLELEGLVKVEGTIARVAR